MQHTSLPNKVRLVLFTEGISLENSAACGLKLGTASCFEGLLLSCQHLNSACTKPVKAFAYTMCCSLPCAGCHLQLPLARAI